MKKIFGCIVAVAAVAFLALPAYAADELAERMNGVLAGAVENGHWQVNSDEVNMWIKTGQKDFLVVDVRPKAAAYAEAHIPGAIHIPYNRILGAESLKTLPKDKKLVLVCATGQLENLPVVPLRMLGYDAYTMTFGYASWIAESAGAEQMNAIIEKAETKSYPVEP